MLRAIVGIGVGLCVTSAIVVAMVWPWAFVAAIPTLVLVAALVGIVLVLGAGAMEVLLRG